MPTQWKRSPEELHKTYIANTEAFYRTAGRGLAEQMDAFCTDCATGLFARSAEAQESIKKIKGVGKCPNCGADMEQDESTGIWECPECHYTENRG